MLAIVGIGVELVIAAALAIAVELVIAVAFPTAAIVAVLETAAAV